MRMRLLMALSLNWLLAADAPKDDAVKKGMEGLQGSWKLTAVAEESRPETKENLKKADSDC